MGDLIRSGDQSAQEIIAADAGLRLKALAILIAEKTHQLDGVNLKLNQLKTIEVPRLELQKDVIAKEIDQLRQNQTELAREAGAKDGAVDAEFTVND
jgi:hypothetical protein